MGGVCKGLLRLWVALVVGGFGEESLWAMPGFPAGLKDPAESV